MIKMAPLRGVMLLLCIAHVLTLGCNGDANGGSDGAAQQPTDAELARACAAVERISKASRLSSPSLLISSPGCTVVMALMRGS